MNKKLLDRLPPVSIRVTLPTLLAILIVVTVVLIGSMAFISGQHAITDLADQLTQEITTRIEDHVRAFLDTPHMILELNSSAYNNHQLDLEHSAELQHVFASQVKLRQSAPFIYYGSEKSEFLGIQRESDSSLILWLLDETTSPNLTVNKIDAQFEQTELIDSVEFDPRTRPWYLAAVEKGDATWSPIFPDISRPVLILTAVMPIFESHSQQLHGVMGIELSLEQLGDFLTELEISKTGQAFIIDREGNIVTTSSRETPYISSEDGPVRLSASASKNPVIRATAEHILQEYRQYDRIDERKNLSVSIDGETQLIQITPFQDNRGIDWLIVVVIPQSDLMGPIYANVRTTVILGIIVLVIAILLGLLIARWIIIPIITLTDTASDIENGEYNIARLDATSKRRDELGILSLVFQQMALEVYVREQHLKEQVQKLKIQIDENKRRVQVNDITETDFFKDLRSKAQKMRQQREKSSGNTTPSED